MKTTDRKTIGIFQLDEYKKGVMVLTEVNEMGKIARPRRYAFPKEAMRNVDRLLKNDKI